MTLRLVLEEDGKQKEFKLNQASATIGRTADNQIRVKSSMSSRQHCKVFRTDSGYVVQDLNSRNGTKVNGKTIKKHDLVVGDRIEIGNSYIHFGQVKAASPSSAGGAKSAKTGGLALKSIQPASPDLTQLNQFPFIIGTQENCTLKLSVNGVAGNHCMIMKANDSYFVVDMNSDSGTLINGAKVSRENLQVGQILQLGDAILQVVDAAPAPVKPVKKIADPDEFDPDLLEDDEDDEDDDDVEDKAPPPPKQVKKQPSKTSTRKPAKPSVRTPGKSARTSKRRSKPTPRPELNDDGLGAELSKIDIQAAESATPAWLVTVQSLLVVVILVVVFGAAVSILLQFLGQPKYEEASSNNLITNWSFEEPLAADQSVSGWTLEASGDGVGIDFVALKSKSRQRLNKKALKMTVPSAKSATVSTGFYAVKANQAVKAAAQFVGQGSGAFGIQLHFADARETIISEPIVDFANSNGEHQLSGLATAPKNATSVKLSVFARADSGALEAQCDRVELSILEKSDYSAVDATRGNLRIASSRRGLLQIDRDNGNGFKPIINRVALGLVDPNRVKANSWVCDPLHSLRAARIINLPKARKRGLRFRGELYDSHNTDWRKVVLDVEPFGAALSARYKLEKPKTENFLCELRFEINNYKSLGQVQMVDVDGRGDTVQNLFNQAKSESSAGTTIFVAGISELVLGRGAKKLSIRFPEAVKVLAQSIKQKATTGEQMVIRCLTRGFVGEKDITCQFQVANSSALEQARIRALFAKAQDAIQNDKLEEAVSLYTKIISDFYDEKAKQLATTRIQEIDTIAKVEIESLKTAARDLENLQQKLILDQAEAKLNRLMKAFPTSPNTANAKKIVAQMRESYKESQQKSLRTEAQALLAQAQSYRTKQQSALAQAILEQIVKTYPKEFRSVQTATGILERMGAN